MAGELDEATDVFRRLALGETIKARTWQITMEDGTVVHGVNGEIRQEGAPMPCTVAPRFRVGDRVRVARVLDAITTPELVGKHGTIEEVESLPPLWACSCGHNYGPHAQHNYEVRLDETGHQHYLNQQMLEPEGVAIPDATDVARAKATIDAAVDRTWR